MKKLVVKKKKNLKKKIVKKKNKKNRLQGKNKPENEVYKIYELEEKLTKSNISKVDQKWEAIFKNAKTDQIHSVIEEMKLDMEQCLEAKSRELKSVYEEFDYYEEQRQMIVAAHLGGLDNLIGVYGERLVPMRHQFEQNEEQNSDSLPNQLEDLKDGYKGETQKLVIIQFQEKEKHEEDIERIEENLYENLMGCEASAWVASDAFKKRIDKETDSYLSRLMKMKQKCFAYENRPEIIKLRKKDDKNQADIVQLREKIKKLKETILLLRKAPEEFAYETERVAILKERKKRTLNYYINLKMIVRDIMVDDRKRLTMLTVSSSDAIKILRKIFTNRSKIIKQKELCEQYQTLDERRVIRNSEYRQMDSLMGLWRLDPFWEHFGKAELTMMALKKMTAILSTEQQYLKDELSKFFHTIS